MILSPHHGSTQDRKDILYQLNCPQYKTNGKSWLRTRGFTLKKDFAKTEYVRIIGTESRGLLFAVDKPSLGLALLENIHFEQVKRVELVWGVKQFPQKASWNNGVHREPLMVTFFFGSKVKADHFYLPDSPHFIGFFLSRNDRVNKAFTGKNYQDTGRYVCLDTPSPDTMISSSFNPETVYRQVFATKSVPPITGIGIEVDTSGLEKGTSQAFLQSITLFSTPKEEQ